MKKFIDISFRDILNAHIPAFRTSLAVVAAITAVRWLFLHQMPPGFLLLAEILVGGIAFFLVVVVKPQQLLKEVLLQTLVRLKMDTTPDSFNKRFLSWYCSRILVG